MQQAIIWTNDDLIYLRTYAPLGFDELPKLFNGVPIMHALDTMHSFWVLISHLLVYLHACTCYDCAIWYIFLLTHWGRVTHICVSKLTIIGSDNGLSPGRRQAIIWTSAGILLIQTPGTTLSEIVSEIHTFSFKKIHLKMSCGKWRPFCLGLNVLTHN